MTMRIPTIVLAIAIAMLQIVMPAHAGGPNDDPQCVLTNPPGGATALRGTIAVGVQNAAPFVIDDVDFTLRLERGGALAFFRVSVPMTAYAISNEGILCALLNETNPTPSPAAVDLRNAIRAKFGFSPTAEFWLVERSVTKAEIQGPATAQWLCDNTFTTNSPTPSCATPRGASMADVLIYVK